ncbi:hypothetical protein [Clostridium sp. KNHs214]|uniref:hypothetical protein n=1 Tax=Clostridium sp. KNHs214 TaxID=1540257 RepID=UPI00054E348B|nr:hypothetical protein [Clostridium sp. KNHs214]
MVLLPKNKYGTILSIERYFLLTFLAINFLEIYRLYHLKELKTIGDTIKPLKSLAAKELVYFVYEQAKKDVLIEKVLTELKLAC